LDDDGDADLVVANGFGENVSVLLGTGIGTFVPAAGVPLGSAAHAVTLRDLDGDGALDLAVAAPSGLLVVRARAAGRSPPAGACRSAGARSASLPPISTRTGSSTSPWRTR
jgi:hypothetical protein